MLEHLYHKDRLNFPLKRDGAKGEGGWKRITWEGGMDEVAQKLNHLKEKFGPETLAFSHGTYRTYHWGGKRFFNLFGSPNMTGQIISVCALPMQLTGLPMAFLPTGT
ncbi:MAG: molybdopterin-dependent oxidoreductase [Pseudomonadota bacterium]